MQIKEKEMTHIGILRSPVFKDKIYIDFTMKEFKYFLVLEEKEENWRLRELMHVRMQDEKTCPICDYKHGVCQGNSKEAVYEELKKKPEIRMRLLAEGILL